MIHSLRNKFKFCFLPLLFFLPFSWSCGKETYIPPKDHAQKTILVYLAGDNNLYEEVNQKIENLLKAWNPSMGRLLIYADDGINKYSNGNPALFEAVYTTRASIKKIKQYGEQNSASGAQLAEVIKDMKVYAPSNNAYGLIVFSHGTAWTPPGSFARTLNWEITSLSLFMDKDKEMAAEDFVNAIPDNCFEFIVGDICFFSNVELAFALRKKCRFLMGASTEMISPGFTNIYSSSLPLLYQKYTGYLGKFMDTYYQFCINDERGPAFRECAISLINTQATEELAQICREINKLNNSLTHEQIKQIQFLDRKHNSSKPEPHIFFDLEDYLRKSLQFSTTISEDKRNELNAEITKAFSNAVLLKKHTNKVLGITINNYSGLSVYVHQSEYPKLNKAHKNSEWGKYIYD